MTKNIMLIDTLNRESFQKQLTGIENSPADLMRNGIDAVLTNEGPVLSDDAHLAITKSEARYRHLINRIAALIVELTPTGEILYTNQAITLVTGFSAEQLMFCNWLDLLLPLQESTHLNSLPQQFLENGELNAFQTLILTGDGSRKIISWNSAHVLGTNDLIERIIYFGIDVTEQVLVEQELSIAAIAFESQEGMMVADVNGVILRVNNAFTTITGYTSEEVIGKHTRTLQSGHHNVDFYAEMWRIIISTGMWFGEIWNRRKNGESYTSYQSITAVKSINGIVTHYVSSLTDITANHLAAEEIKNLAFYDPLTHLPNRRLLVDRLKQALISSTRTGLEGAVLFIDLDYFKALNDTHGHAIGDLLLQQVAERLTACMRECDTVSRPSGDEYVVVLENLNKNSVVAAAQAESIGRKILAALTQPYQLDKHIYHCSASIGATLFNFIHSSTEELLQQADIAMYQGKKTGRNKLCFFDQQMQDAISARVALENELHFAIERGQFHLYYQIQVDSSGLPLGAEALIRWLHPEHGLVSPQQFIPLAEEKGLILAIGQWVLETACAQLKAWQQECNTSNLTLSVNVSAHQFRQADFVDQVLATIKRHAINPGLLKLELTESIFLTEINDTIVVMDTLRKIGVRFSLDDFGTGYSCLQYLKRLPLDQLKIDRSFVSDITVNSSDKTIVRTIIAMAHSLELDVIAEGVETEEQQQILLEKGCTYYQGYLFGKPVPIEQFNEFLKQR
ncbi:putative bifunctional diguanylate cyclase/phosphodiesterase [Methylobacter psychrophilus]|uniref:putative bifunctional diguanylate cyclase/phosphodiesterase n=1 Tax=Methylobacter psychrophilus TaxID=96941 RepID=UPI0021D4DBB8|nr:bifunctional diguanylate cyclase/phosphodiesterase [Methylobacter psychrophilus]